MNQFTPEQHPEWYHDISQMDFLILGSFPPHIIKRKYEFYYPNTQNRFWKILADISGLPLRKYESFSPELVKERHRIMEALNVGIQNMGYIIERKGIGASDNDIRIKKYQDIISIIKKHPELQRIILPGYSAANSTLWSFLKYLNENGIIAPEIKNPKGGITEFKIQIENKSIECKVVYSTSTATKLNYEIVLNQFKNALDLNR